jgi:hypothetical protein
MSTRYSFLHGGGVVDGKFMKIPQDNEQPSRDIGPLVNLQARLCDP